MKTRTIRRLLWSFFTLLTATLLTLDFYVTSRASNAQTENLRRSLSVQAAILAHSMPASNQLEDWVKTAAAQAQSRVTVLDSAGAPIVSAEAESISSQPVSAGLVSVTIPAPPGAAPAASLQISESDEPIRESVRSLWGRLILLSAFSLVLLAAVSWIFVHSLSRQISHLQIYSERLLDPQIPELEVPSGDDDLGALGRSLRRTVPRIRELVENLKLEGARREAILASMLEGVLAVDKDLRVTFCNNSFARTVGARIPVNPGMQLVELVRDPALIEIITGVIASGERVESRLSLAAAETHSFEVLAGPLAGPSTRGTLVILHDVTELERLERVRKDFVANVSHELRTPLAAIRGYAETLLDGALEDHENNRRFVEIIQAQATRLTNIASDLLTLSQLESTGAATQPAPVSVRGALESALRTVESAARVRGVQLVCPGMENIQVLGNDLQLEQVFVNLLDNAVKFNRPGGEVQVDVRPTDGNVRISISDTGIGIPSGDLPRIFERFYRVDKARSREMGGTGLGLAIVKHVIEQMGGTVTVESRLGHGSRFLLTLPRFNPIPAK